MTSALQNSGLFNAEPEEPGMTSLLAYGLFPAVVSLILAVAFTGRGFLIAREMQIFLQWTRFHRRET